MSTLLKSEILSAILIFLFTLLLSLWQNPSSTLPRTTLYFDSAHYLETTKRLYEAATALFSGKLNYGQLDSLAFYLFLDGPVLPGAGALAFALFNKAPVSANWQCLVWMQCFFHALSASLLYLLARLALKRRIFALLAAILWASYPAAICAGNSFLTEPLAVLLLLSYLCFLALTKEKIKDWQEGALLVAAFACFALLSLLKPALAPAAFILAAIYFTVPLPEILPALSSVFVRRKLEDALKEKLKSYLLGLSFAAVGLALVIIPWLGFTYSARHELLLLPSRRPVYNICTGLNIESDGWGTHPTQALAACFDDSEQALPILLGLCQSEPLEISNLSLRKLTRFWAQPWNDYRYKILGLNYKLQALAHLMLVVLGFSGFCLVIARLLSAEQLKPASRVTFTGAVVIICGHLIYLPFEGISRYGFSSVPLLILCALYLVEQLLPSIRAKEKLKWLLSFLFCTLLFAFLVKFDTLPFLMPFLPEARLGLYLQAALKTVSLVLVACSLHAIFASGSILKLNPKAPDKVLALVLALFVLLGAFVSFAFASSCREAHGWQSNLKTGDEAVRQIEIKDALSKNPDWALLLIDGNQELANAAIKVNGNCLAEKAESLYQFWREKYELEDWLNQFASLLRKSPDSLRKWRALQVPLGSLHEGLNTVSISPAAGGRLSLYGDFRESSFKDILLLPSASEVSPGKFFNESEDGFDSRIMQSTSTCMRGSAASFLYMNGKLHDAGKPLRDLSSAAGLQSGDFRIRLVLGYRHGGALSKVTLSDEQKASKQAAAKFVLVPFLSLGGLGQNGQTAEPNKQSRFEFQLNEKLLSSSHLKLLIRGSALAKSGRLVFSIAAVTPASDRFMSSVWPGTPRLIETSLQAQEQPFSLESVLPTVAFNRKDARIRVELVPVEGAGQVKNLEAELFPVEKPDFSKHSLKFY